MDLSVAYNWDYNLIDRLKDVPEVKDVYGSLNSSFFGSGRPVYMIKKIKPGEMARHIHKFHENNIQFNYTLNAPCLNNAEFQQKEHKKLIEHLEWLISTGIDSITVSMPFVIELIKNRYPTLYTKVSVIANVNSVKKVKYYEDLGVDEIVIDFMINRDFKTLENIKKSAQCNLSLLLNDGCIFDCIYRNSHFNSMGHSSQMNNKNNGFFVEYNVFKCTIARLNNPSLLISSPWIRPEDIKHYENIGYTHFKIGGRKMSSNWIMNAVKAYTGRKYEENLSDILNYPLPGYMEETMPPQMDIIRKGLRKLKSSHLR